VSRHERPDDRDESLIDGALDEEARRADDDVEEHVPPSFAAIVARAHRIDPRAVGADDVERATRATRTPRRREPEPIGEDELASMIATLRAEAERDIAKRERAGLPPCGLLVRIDVQRRNARTRQWIAGFSAVAAAAAVVLGLDWLERWNARRTFDEHEATQSVSAVQGGAVPLSTVVPAEALPAVPPKPQRAVPVPAPEVAPPAVLPSEPAPLELSADPSAGLASGSTLPRPRDVPRDAAAKVPADAALRKLDALAQDALARGERSEADELYAKVIAKGRKHPLVEIAYAERFSLARGGGSAAQRELWNGYLAAFPQGRFADDAHAGLCRTAPIDDKATCWQGYVDRFPAGAYRRHAEDWLVVSATP
jgi:hypothetical protein